MIHSARNPTLAAMTLGYARFNPFELAASAGDRANPTYRILMRSDALLQTCAA
jgi:hypothetical protein